ncbi:DUF6265 family protein [Algoriphagus sediminis]|uniref:DUF6265 family protein n=1 Tax=Algoriphagus sediminis TaxID=3057113 RepID=A0ABT7Y860_9BACT|nr:DUF6265 family protein [Algoriphagus sediminis]MDN3202661.1 DUF6265 family protein [Algoriphagus sediminis]
MRVLLSIFIYLFFSSTIFAQVRFLEENEDPGKGKVTEIAWLQGYWEGTGFGGECEESWSAPKSGEMVGTFRLLSEDKTTFLEFMRIIPEGDSFTLKVRHYNPDGKSWEENGEWVDFKLIEITPSAVWFDGMTIEREGDQLTYHVALGGDREIAKLVLKKRNL